MTKYFLPELSLGGTVSSKQMAACLDPASEGVYIEIDVGDHSAALMAVWKMSDDDRSPQLEANVNEIVRRVNEYDNLIKHLGYACDFLKACGHTSGGTPEALFKLLESLE